MVAADGPHVRTPSKGSGTFCRRSISQLGKVPVITAAALFLVVIAPNWFNSLQLQSARTALPRKPKQCPGYQRMCRPMTSWSVTPTRGWTSSSTPTRRRCTYGRLIPIRRSCGPAAKGIQEHLLPAAGTRKPAFICRLAGTPDTAAGHQPCHDRQTVRHDRDLPGERRRSARDAPAPGQGRL